MATAVTACFAKRAVVGHSVGWSQTVTWINQTLRPQALQWSLLVCHSASDSLIVGLEPESMEKERGYSRADWCVSRNLPSTAGQPGVLKLNPASTRVQPRSVAATFTRGV